MTKSWPGALVFCLASLTAIAAIPVHAEPITSVTGERLPGLRKIIYKVRNQGALDAKDVAFLSGCIHSRDAVLLSAAAWVVGEAKVPENSLIDQLGKEGLGLGDMADAYVSIALEKIGAKKAGAQWSPSSRILGCENPYLRLELIREFARMGIVGDTKDASERRRQVDAWLKDGHSLNRIVIRGLEHRLLQKSKIQRAYIGNEHLVVLISILDGD